MPVYLHGLFLSFKVNWLSQDNLNQWFKSVGKKANLSGPSAKTTLDTALYIIYSYRSLDSRYIILYKHQIIGHTFSFLQPVLILLCHHIFIVEVYLKGESDKPCFLWYMIGSLKVCGILKIKHHSFIIPYNRMLQFTENYVIYLAIMDNIFCAK